VSSQAGVRGGGGADAGVQKAGAANRKGSAQPLWTSRVWDQLSPLLSPIPFPQSTGAELVSAQALSKKKRKLFHEGLFVPQVSSLLG
jgi:hypothetical protein